MRPIFRTIARLALFLVLLFPASARAACTLPDGIEGAVIYNATYKVAQFCNGDDWISMAGGGGSSGVTDGDKTDITVSGSGATWTIDAEAVSYAKIQNVSGPNKLLGRYSAGAGVVQELTLGTGLSLNTSTGEISVTASGTTTGTGSANYVAKWTGASALGDSTIFDNGTNVGIGTATPQSLLSVGNTGYAQFSRTFAGAPTGVDCDAATEAGRVTYDTTGNAWYVCEGAGGWQSASGASGVTTLAALTDVDVGALGNGKVLTYNTTASKWEAVTPAAATTPAGSVAGAVQFRGSSAVFAADDANFIWDNTNKRLGIGNATPARSLDIGSNGLRVTAGAGNQAVQVHKSSTYNTENTAGIAIDDGTADAGMLLGADAANDLAYIQSLDPGTSYGTRALVLNGMGGNVGIGTTNPTAKLEVGGARPITLNPALGAVSIQGDTGGWALRYGAYGSSGTDRGGFGFTGAADALTNYWIGPTYSSPHLVILANGNVGIGTTTPSSSALLDVSSTTKGFLLPRMSTAQVTTLAGLTPADGMMVYDTDTDTIKLRANGAFVSLGSSAGGGNTMVSGWPDALRCSTTSYGYRILYASGMPSNDGLYWYIDPVYHAADLVVAYTNAGNFSSAGANMGATDCNATIASLYSSGKSFNFVGGGATAAAAGTSGQIQFNTSSNLNADAALVWDNANKRLGIGTTTPSAKLDITGPVQISGSAVSSLMPNSAILSYESGLAASRLIAIGPDSSTAGQLNLTVADSAGGHQSNIVLTSAGNVGIGTTNPVGKLDVRGGSATYGIYMNGGMMYLAPTSAGANQGLALDATGMAAGSNAIFIFSGGTNLFKVYKGGGITASGLANTQAGYYMCYDSSSGSFNWGGACNNANSDIRLKQDIRPLGEDEGLDAVMRLKPVHYRWRDIKQNQSEGPQIGLIAQDVKKFLPALVTDIGTPTTVHLEGGRTEVVNDTQGLKYHLFIFPMIKAIQELKADNDNLRAELEAANDNYGELRNELDALKADAVRSRAAASPPSTPVEAR